MNTDCEEEEEEEILYLPGPGNLTRGTSQSCGRGAESSPTRGRSSTQQKGLCSLSCLLPLCLSGVLGAPVRWEKELLWEKAEVN